MHVWKFTIHPSNSSCLPELFCCLFVCSSNSHNVVSSSNVTWIEWLLGLSLSLSWLQGYTAAFLALLVSVRDGIALVSANNRKAPVACASLAVLQPVYWSFSESNQCMNYTFGSGWQDFKNAQFSCWVWLWLAQICLWCISMDAILFNWHAPGDCCGWERLWGVMSFCFYKQLHTSKGRTCPVQRVGRLCGHFWWPPSSLDKVIKPQICILAGIVIDTKSGFDYSLPAICHDQNGGIHSGVVARLECMAAVYTQYTHIVL